jgi:16S rRNA (guanine966-N2)-methyltransferase
VRQALFNILGPLQPPLSAQGEGVRVLDLFAGSGALGLESLSRGATQAVFVEHDPQALLMLRDNLRELDLVGRAEVLPLPVDRALARLSARMGPPFSLVFADPPYREELLPALLERLGDPGCRLLAPDATVVVEYARVKGLRGPGPAYGRLVREDERCYGQTALSFYSPRPLGPAEP